MIASIWVTEDSKLLGGRIHLVKHLQASSYCKTLQIGFIALCRFSADFGKVDAD